MSLTPRRELRALALPSEIMRLENLHGYVKFPGPFPAASIRLKYLERGAAAERFVPRVATAPQRTQTGTRMGIKLRRTFRARGRYGCDRRGEDGGHGPEPRQGELDLALPVEEEGTVLKKEKPSVRTDCSSPAGPGWPATGRPMAEKPASPAASAGRHCRDDASAKPGDWG